MAIGLIKLFCLVVDDALEEITNTMGINIEDVGIHEELIGIGIIDFIWALIYS